MIIRKPAPHVIVCLSLLWALSGPVSAQGMYLVTGSDMGPRYNHVQIWGSGVAVSDAVVTVNGTPLPWTGSIYSADLGTTVPAGDTLTLTIEVGGETIVGKDAVPEAPPVTGPADGSSFTPLDPVQVTWASSTDPDRFLVNTYCPDDCDQQEWEVPGDQRSFEIAAGVLPVNVGVVLRVYAYNDGSFTGPADPASAMNIRAATGGNPTITVIQVTPVEEMSWGLLKSRFQ